jgi:large-conductance mechanosensitive channel
MSAELTEHNFSSFIISYISLSVIAGLFTYRVLNSFLDNIILPLLDISILPDKKFHKLTKVYNHDKTQVKEVIKKEDIKYIIRPGIFLKELVIWCFIMMLLYIIYKLTKKN